MLGYNFRLNELQSALGLSQLKQLDNFIKKRIAIAKYYKKELYSLPLSFKKIQHKSISAYHLFIIQTEKIQK